VTISSSATVVSSTGTPRVLPVYSARMPDDAVLDGLDPYDLMEAETARLDTYLSALDASGWDRQSACADWTTRDMLGHLAGSEEYNHACLDDTLPAFLEGLGERGATDLDSFNAIGVADRAGRSSDEVLAEWRETCRRTTRELRARDGGDIPTMVGRYPARWQAFHLASELAAHADDVGVPVTEAEAADRADWRRRFALFVLSETKPDVEATPVEGGTKVRAGGEEAVLSDDDLIAVTNGRLPADHPLAAGLRSALNVVGS
jgi:uncharacterized protein (TIGR03083 family)